MCKEAALSRCFTYQAPWVVEGLFVSYKGNQGGFEELWISGTGLVEEPAILQRHAQGCVEPLRGLEGSNVTLSAPTGAARSYMSEARGR
jgi:hypothetical protein